MQPAATSRALAAALRLADELARHRDLSLLVRCWRRAAEDSQRQRREALFDAMAQQVEAVKRRCSAFEALSARCVEASDGPAVLQLVTLSWRCMARSAREQRGLEALASWSSRHREAALHSWWAARAFAAWARGGDEAAPAAVGAEHSGAAPSDEPGGNWTTEASKLPYDDLRLEDQAGPDGKMQLAQKDIANPAHKTLRRPSSLQRRHSHHSLGPPPGSLQRSGIVGGSLNVPCGGLLSPRCGATGYPTCAAQTGAADRGGFRAAPGSMSVPYGGCWAGCQTPAPEPKKSLPRGPERFFYDSTTYTGCARFGGPSVVDKENVAGAAAGRAKASPAYPPASSPRIAPQTASTSSLGGACQAPAPTPGTRRRMLLLR